MNLKLIGLALAVTVGLARSQTNPAARLEFEVASVKPDRSMIGTVRRIGPGSITYLNITLGEFIEMAYGVRHSQILGPDWVVNFGSPDRYDIVARAASPISAEPLQRMLGPLLVERFQLVFHRETRELPVYALVVAKNGPKFKAGDGGVSSVNRDKSGGVFCKNCSMASLADSISYMASVGRPVLDRTGLEGGYSFQEDFCEIPKGASAAEIKNASLNCDAIFSNLQEQLGLKLKAQRAPIELLIIDHAEKVPTEN